MKAWNEFKRGFMQGIPETMFKLGEAAAIVFWGCLILFLSSIIINLTLHLIAKPWRI